MSREFVKRFMLIALVSATLAALVDASLNNLIESANPAKLSFSVRECASRSNETSGQPRITAEGGTIKMRHELNNVCCAGLSLDWQREDSSISITEAGDETCDGSCDYLIQAEVTGLASGHYSMQVFGAEGLLAQQGVALK